MRLGENEKKGLLLAGGLFCLVTAFVLISTFHGKFGTVDDRVQSEDAAVLQTTPNAAHWVVYVTGAVRNPGIHEVATGSRAHDAVSAAGGFSEDADPEAINLAAHLEDGAQVKVPRKTASMSQAEGNAVSSGSRETKPPMPAGGKLNVNKCSASELTALPGIDAKLAAAIVEHRKKRGPFKKIADLHNVKGIGEKRFDAIKGFIVVADR